METKEKAELHELHLCHQRISIEVMANPSNIYSGWKPKQVKIHLLNLMPRLS